jgi:hypothetical protein
MTPSFIISIAPSAASQAVAYRLPAPLMVVDLVAKYKIPIIRLKTAKEIMIAVTSAKPVWFDSLGQTMVHPGFLRIFPLLMVFPVSCLMIVIS